MYITRVNLKNGVGNYQLTKKMHKDLMEFKKKRGGSRMKDIIWNSMIFTANCLSIYKNDDNDVRLNKAREYFEKNSLGAAEGELGIIIPFDIKLLEKEITTIKECVGTDKDWLAVWFGIEFYIRDLYFKFS